MQSKCPCGSRWQYLCLKGAGVILPCVFHVYVCVCPHAIRRTGQRNGSALNLVWRPSCGTSLCSNFQWPLAQDYTWAGVPQQIFKDFPFSFFFFFFSLAQNGRTKLLSSYFLTSLSQSSYICLTWEQVLSATLLDMGSKYTERRVLSTQSPTSGSF